MSNNPTRTAVLTALLILPLVGAGDEGPKSPKARAAIRKYEKVVERANADRDRAVAAAAQDLRAELDASLKAAMKAGSLEEAKAIEAVGKSLAAPAAKSEKARDLAASLVGTWDVVCANRMQRTYTIDPQGRIAWGDRRAQLVSTPHGVAGPIGFEQGKRERCTSLTDGRLLVEHFAPDSAFPDGPPDQIGLGVPSKD